MAEPFIGEIRLLPFSFDPEGWFECDGRLLKIAEHSSLFALLGTTYGGDGRSNFALPDLRGRIPVGRKDVSSGAPFSLGQRGGSELTTLHATNIPPHQHSLAGGNACVAFRATTAEATANTPGTDSHFAKGCSSNRATVSIELYSSAGVPDVAMTQVATISGNTVSAGAGEPMPNVQPYLAARYCMAWEGIFPPRQ
jgi:microcystin-dependent protein